MLAYPSWLINVFPLDAILRYLKVVAAVSSSEGYQTSAVEKHAALALAEGTAASGHNKTPRRECGVCACRVYIYKSRVADQNN